MKQSRRNHSSKLKARIALDALRGDTTLSELSSCHGVHANQISTWRKQLLERAGEVFEHGNPAAGVTSRPCLLATPVRLISLRCRHSRLDCRPTRSRRGWCRGSSAWPVEHRNGVRPRSSSRPAECSRL